MEAEREGASLGTVLAALNSLLDRADKPAAEKSEEDWEAEGQVRDRLPEAYRLHDYRLDGKRTVGVVNCEISEGLPDTPVCLYRLLFLFSHQAKREKGFAVDFEDMYKSASLFAILSPQGHFVVDPQFYKYELCLGLRARREYLAGQLGGVICGVPGAENGMTIADPLLASWWKLLLRLLSRRWSVYSGNNFEV